MSVSERVALRLVLPGVVVTWFVTGFLDPGKVDGQHPVLLEPALWPRQAYDGGSAKAGNVAGTIPSAVSCGGPVTPGLAEEGQLRSNLPRRRLVAALGQREVTGLPR